MRCESCNKRLSMFEETRKYKSTGDYVGLCNRCFSDCGYIPVRTRTDLLSHNDDVDSAIMKDEEDDQ